MPSQTVNVYEVVVRKESPGRVINIKDQDIWNVLQPVIPKITNIVKANRHRDAFSKFYPDEPDREPELDWIFFRKYSPNAERNSLTVHQDTNMNTVNIELSDDYEGGGFFYMKPLASTGFVLENYDGYEWTESVKRKNTSDIIFPDIHAGDAIFYNYTVDHAVAPVESGTRVSTIAGTIVIAFQLLSSSACC